MEEVSGASSGADRNFGKGGLLPRASSDRLRPWV